MKTKIKKIFKIRKIKKKVEKCKISEKKQRK